MYAPATGIMVERAYSVTPVCQSASDGVSNLRLIFLALAICVFELPYQVGASVSFGHISSLGNK